MGAEINFQGMDELLRHLEKIGQRSEEIKTKALEEGSEIFRSDIEQRAPRGKGTKHLADHIIKEINGDTVKIGPFRDYFYGHFLEFGTRKMSARPFMGPAFESNKLIVQEKMADVLRKELEL